ncbi:MAG: DNA mismatch repair endonuclease MutL [Bacteroidales bacterium]|nr:DNA mismatch repair endonuclease MutL [Bacteroidales bacterium]
MDIIQILPDSVANQIAAGEVIQRPASAVKELTENAIDAGAGAVTIIIREAGKSLIQVIDNGCGMSETDARLCFERHATSKIRKSEDLNLIKTLGFRGEAMASIAAIAQIEIKTKTKENELGTRILIEGSEVKLHEVCSCPDGTSIMVKNLFYNVPVRRKFLKSNAAEMRHIIEEFTRIAIINPGVEFQLLHNNNLIYKLPAGNMKQRIVGLFGADYNKKLLPLNEEASFIKFGGFVGKPEFARKTRGEQYFFANNRYIRHPYLNHAVENAFQELLPGDAFPSYFITIDIDPALIDINIHPTKTEINFQNSQLIYNLIKSSVKKALGQYSVDEMDFNKDMALNMPAPDHNRQFNPPEIRVNPDFNPFRHEDKPGGFRKKPAPEHWEKLYEGLREKPPAEGTGMFPADAETQKEDGQKVAPPFAEDAFQLNNLFLVTKIKSGLVIIDQTRAHQRILFEKFMSVYEGRKEASQQQLFPVTIDLPPQDSNILIEILDEIRQIGFDIENFGGNTFLVRGAPAGLNNGEVKEVLEKCIESFKKNTDELNPDKRVNLARSMAVNMSVKPGKKLRPEEVRELINQLFACEYPGLSPDGKPALIMLSIDELFQKFK